MIGKGEARYGTTAKTQQEGLSDAVHLYVHAQCVHIRGRIRHHPADAQKFVEQLHWIDEEEMMDLTAIAQSSPGAIAVNASILVGYRVAGVPGALVTVLGTVLPPLIILSIISFFYTAFRDNRIVALVMRGMQAGVAAVICDVVLTMGRSVLGERRVLPVVMLLGAFAAARFFGVNVVAIILVCGAVGAADLWRRQRTSKGGRAQ